MKKKSVRNKYKGKTYAEVAEKIGKKYPERDYNLVQRRAYEAEMRQLIQSQEAQRTAETAKEMRKGGWIKKYSGGGGFDPQDFYRGHVDPMTVRAAPIEPSFWDKAKSFGKKAWGATKDWYKEDAAAPAILGKGLNLAVNLGQIMGGYDKVQPHYNPYEGDVRRNLASRRVDMTPIENKIMSSRNAMMKQNRNNARSLNTQRSLDANTESIVADKLSQAGFQEQTMNNRYRMQEAGMLGRLGQQKARANFMADELTARNKGAHQSQVSQFGQQLGDISMVGTKARMTRAYNQLMTDVLNNKYADFAITPDLVNRLFTGDATPQEKLIMIKSGAMTAEQIEALSGFKATPMQQTTN